MAGLTDQGFEPLQAADIKTGMETDVQSALGKSINLDARGILGQIIGVIVGGLALIWAALELIWQSQSPNKATGNSLDGVVALNGLTRLPQLMGGVVVKVFGDEGTTIAAGLVVSVAGAPASRFISFEAKTIGTLDVSSQVWTLGLSPGTPASGVWRVTFMSVETADLAHDISAATLQSALEGLGSIGSGNILVAGDMATGFTLTFQGALENQQQEAPTITKNTLSSAQTFSMLETNRGGFGVDVGFQCEDFGAIAAPAYSLTVIETPVAGVDSVLNYKDADQGRLVETDAELRQRRADNIQRKGTATIDGIRSALLNDVAGVTVALVVENATGVVDGEGNNPKSIHCILEGGDEQAIADKIWATKGGGIETMGNVSKTVVASDGLSHTVKFSRPTLVDIYLIINITANTDPAEGQVYPVDGDAQVVAAMVEFGSTYTRGEDVVVNRLFTPINTVPGVIGIEILLGFAPSPSGTTNLAIAFNEVARFQGTNITVNS